MELKGKKFENCKKCGKTYTLNPFSSSRRCPECDEEYENTYRIVRDYLYDNRGATAIQISEATGASIELIMEYVKEERFILAE